MATTTYESLAKNLYTMKMLVKTFQHKEFTRKQYEELSQKNKDKLLSFGTVCDWGLLKETRCEFFPLADGNLMGKRKFYELDFKRATQIVDSIHDAMERHLASDCAQYHKAIELATRNLKAMDIAINISIKV